MNKTAATSASSSKAKKRRNERNILTFYEKIAVIHYYNETNISRNSLAKMFHCCATQIRRILEKKHELLQQQATMSEADASIIIEEMTRKRRKFEMSAISFILHQWVERCRELSLRKSITNHTLKETAIKMAAILNLPAFRPSYRWLNRFRSKYKYNAPDLGVGDGMGEVVGVAGDLAVEDIIIEFKDALPSFMQKEIAAITSSIAKTESGVISPSAGGDDKGTAVPLQPNKRIEEPLEKQQEVNDERRQPNEERRNEDSAEVDGRRVNNNSAFEFDLDNSKSLATSSAETATSATEHKETGSNVLQNIFPHLAVVHRFALLNSDVKALELISQLGVHMQTQASAGMYKELSLATIDVPLPDEEMRTLVASGGVYADIDDIVLME